MFYLSKKRTYRKYERFFLFYAIYLAVHRGTTIITRDYSNPKPRQRQYAQMFFFISTAK